MFTILYVDDEPALLEIGKLFLEQGGRFSVETIDSATKALEILRTKRYDVIVSDYQMPGMDGIEFLKRVRASGNSIPFIVFTGRGREEIVIQALNEGADFYLQKGGEPLSQFAELGHKIQKAILERRAEASIRNHERREADIINFLPDATFAIDTRGVVIAWNRAMEKMTGVPAAEILGKGDHEYAIPIYRERRPILIDLVIADDPALGALYPYVKREGKTLFAEITIPHFNDGRGAAFWLTASPLYDTGGHIVGAIQSIREITRWKRTSRALNESEQKYRTVFETTGTATLLIENDATISLVNSEFARLSGYSKEEIENKKKWTEFVVREDLDRMLSQHALRRKNRQAALTHYEFRFLTRSGEIRDIFLTIDVIPGTVKSVASLLDITERKKAEDQLIAAGQEFTNLLDQIQDVYYRSDENGRLIRGSRSLAMLLGYNDLSECIGRSIADDFYFDPGDRTRFLEAITREGKVSDYEVLLKRKDGTPMLVSTNSHLNTDATGRILGVEGTFRDITERKRAEAALRVAQEKYTKAFHSVLDAMTISELDSGRFVEVNEAATALFGYSREELMGKSAAELGIWLNAEDRAAFIDQVKKNGRIRECEVVERRKSGELYTALINAHTLTVGDRNYLISVIRDITERKRAEQVIREANRKINLLTSITRHDVANQISIIRGFTGLAVKKKPGPEITSFLEKIDMAVSVAAQQIEFTREYQELGMQAPDWQSIRTIVGQQKAEGITLSCTCDAEVYADPMLERVFFNLFDNAIRHGERVTEITVSCRAGPDTLVIVVADNGTGVPPDLKERIFEKGFGKNTGFGLFLAREILAITGISIRETGTSGRGAQFEIIVPKGTYRFVS